MRTADSGSTQDTVLGTALTVDGGTTAVGTDSLKDYEIADTKTLDQYIQDAHDATNPAFAEWLRGVEKRRRQEERKMRKDRRQS